MSGTHEERSAMTDGPSPAIEPVPDDGSAGMTDLSQDSRDLATILQLVENLWSQLPETSEPVRSSAPAPPVMESGQPPGDEITIGRFVFQRELGRGGGGIVMMAFDPFLRRTVALKVPGPQALTSLVSRDRFLSEARAIATLRHPNIVAVHEAGEAGRIPYLVMDYCEGGSLADWLANRPADQPVPAPWAARLVVQIARGVQHAHDRGILHRDLKPSNILLQPLANDGTVGPEALDDLVEPPDALGFVPQVADFGLAKACGVSEPGRESTLQGAPLGTLPYMSAEAARGDGRAIGPATDVYGLGVILFELLTGRRPFVGSSPIALLDQVQNAEPPSPREFRKGLPVDVETICLKCLQKNSSDRYQSPSELTNELQRFLAHLPILARPAPPWRRVAARVRRHPVRAAIIGLSLLAMSAFVVAMAWFVEQERRRETQVLLRQLETADVVSLPELVPKLDPTDPRVADRIGRLFVTGTPNQKLAAALVMAKTRSKFGDYCSDRLLEAAPREIVPLAGLLNGWITGKSLRLEKELAVQTEPGSPSDEAADKRRANAACALIALGESDLGWSLLRFAPNPQARTFLIHLLGPAGISPGRIVDRIVAEGDSSIRRALIQALGEVPDVAWSARHRDGVQKHLLGLYENDPDSGVHGSAKWLLLRWGLGPNLHEIDDRLSRSPQPVGRRWRISPTGLTLVEVRDGASGYAFEVSDIEVTVARFLEFRPDFRYLAEFSPKLDHPINSINYVLAARFCNWLTEKEGLGRDALCYRKGAELPIEPVADQDRRLGYRLLTDREFELACRAGTTTARYHGESVALLSRYAHFGLTENPKLSSGAELKPNDLGLFDMLGNAIEVCQNPRKDLDPRNQAVLCGGMAIQPAPYIRSDAAISDVVIERAVGTEGVGFRVARTIHNPAW
jgi:hypothetical protein